MSTLKSIFRIFILFSLVFCFSPNGAKAAPKVFDPIDPNHWYPIGEKHILGSRLIELEQKLPRLEADKEFFHWTRPSLGRAWARDGKLQDKDVEAMNVPTGDRQASGAGVYLAESSSSSSQYGVFPVILTVSKGTPRYDSAIVKEFFKSDWDRPLTDLEMSQLGALIPFVRWISGDWWITQHPKNTRQVRYAAGQGGAHFNPLGEVLSLNRDPKQALLKFGQIEYVEKTESGPVTSVPAGLLNDEYLNRLTTAIKAQDVLTLMRSAQVEPGAVGKSGKNFESFHTFLTELGERPEKDPLPEDLKSRLRAPVNAWEASTELKNQLADEQVDRILPELMKRLTGHAVYRNQARSSGKEIYVTPIQLHELTNLPLHLH